MGSRTQIWLLLCIYSVQDTHGNGYGNQTHFGRSGNYTLNKGLMIGSLLQAQTIDGRPLAVGQCAVKDQCDCVLDTYIQRPRIDCRYKSLQGIPKFILVSTVYADIDFSASNHIRQLQNNSFANLKVERINLLNNEMNYIGETAFDGLEAYLKELFMEGNSKILIPYRSLTKLSNLTRLTLTGFQQLNPVENQVFDRFPNLIALTMMNIDKLSLEETTFKGKVPQLQYLELKNVYIRQIPVLTLRHTTSLKVLKIIENTIQAVYNHSFQNLINLQTLDLSHDQIASLEEQSFYVVSKTLKTLDLDSNHLQVASLKALSSQQWPNLDDLQMSYNADLKSIPDNTFKNMPKLKSLSLVGLGIQTVTSNLLYGLNNLKMLDLSSNNIQKIDNGAFQRVDEYFELKLEGQGAVSQTTIPLVLKPEAFQGLETKLYTLNLENTKLDENQFWSTIKHLRGLENLLLRKTGLKTIPPYAFQNNKKLSHLKLEENEINQLDKLSFKGLEESLRKIYLLTNNIKTISECVFMNFTQLSEIYLFENPLQCDCKLKWLRKFAIESSNPDSIFKEEIKCASPPSLVNRKLYEIPEVDLVCIDPVDDECASATTLMTTVTTKATSNPTSQPANALKLSVGAATTNSITVFWSLKNMQGITGYKLWYFIPSDKQTQMSLNIHRDVTVYQITKLRSGTFYMICVMAEVNLNENSDLQACHTSQTDNDPLGPDPYNEEQIAKNRQYMIAGIICAIVVLVLITAGICAVMKYRYKARRLNDLLTIATPGQMRSPAYSQENILANALPSDYSEISAGSLAKYLAEGRSPRNLRQGLFVFNADENLYNTMNSINSRHLQKRKNPYENDDEEEDIEKVKHEPAVEMKDESVNYRKEERSPIPSERHSAPSRLNATDLLMTDCTLRPLPATPSKPKEQTTNQRRSNTMQTKVKTKKARESEDKT
ncbi:slit homolog 3 protein-like [Dreissena polymorpha]|uniref:slit homolog 3 protein-like n=1 Tax=Dreissena polymorpha TaxID=45954 RepID=UPI002264BBF2|nr:slit homolog 3 protein-like [Dreissena polymorpha]XP_052273917.1 slit homolog 3 protein-like [Dreissena polymorpha]